MMCDVRWMRDSHDRFDIYDERDAGHCATHAFVSHGLHAELSVGWTWFRRHSRRFCGYQRTSNRFAQCRPHQHALDECAARDAGCAMCSVRCATDARLASPVRYIRRTRGRLTSDNRAVLARAPAGAQRPLHLIRLPQRLLRSGVCRPRKPERVSRAVATIDISLRSDAAHQSIWISGCLPSATNGTASPATPAAVTVRAR